MMLLVLGSFAMMWAQPTGDTCEDPIILNLPIVNQAYNNEGFTDDYTAPMFTGLPDYFNYLGGNDWVGKITLTSDSWLNITMANQTGYSYQYLSMFLVNTIPSVESPAQVLAQSHSSNGPYELKELYLSAGDYYLIVDNWASPWEIYFVLNINTDGPPTYPLPYTQDFNSGTSLSAIDWQGDMLIAANHGTNGSNGLYRNLYSGVPTTNAATPLIGPLPSDWQIIFDYRYVAYSNYPNTPITLSAGDKLEVQVGINGADYNTVREINHNDHIPSSDFANVVVNLTGYTGQIVKVRFLVTRAAGDYYIDIDNVVVRETPTTAILDLNPDLNTWDFGPVPVGTSVEKEFFVKNTGIGNLVVTSITQSGTTPPFSIEITPALQWSLTNTDPANTFKVKFAPQSDTGPFSTDVTINYNTGAKATHTIHFTGNGYYPATLPLFEDWENGQGDWVFVNGTQTNAWHIGVGEEDYPAFAGDNFAYISNDGGNSVAYTINSLSASHIYRDIAFTDQSLEFNLNFQWKCQGEGTAWDRMRVYLVDLNVTPVAGTEMTVGQVGLSNYNLQSNWTEANITLPGSHSGTVKRLVFSWKNDASGGTQPPINLDNISLTATPVTAPPNPAVLVSPSDGAINVSQNQTLNWNSGGGYVEGYRLSYGTVTPRTTIENNLNLGMDTSYPPNLEYETEYWWTVTPYNYLGNATPVQEWTFTTRDSPIISVPFFEGFESGYTNNASVLGNWEQIVGPEYTTQYWTANNTNTTYNRPPRTGDWNATLRYNGESTLVRPIQLETGTDYEIEFYARQDTNTSTAAKIKAMLGNAPTLAALTEEIIPQTGLIDGDYQKFSGIFSVDTSGVYYIGIQGWLNITPWYISLDDITIREVVGGPPATPILVSPIDNAQDLPINNIILTWQPDLNNGGVPDFYEVFLSNDRDGVFDDYTPIEVFDGITTCNPLTDGSGDIEFDYSETWYWTVIAHQFDDEGGVVSSEPAEIHRFTIEPDPSIIIPHTQNFGTDNTWPREWTQSYSGGITSDRWSKSNTSNAGGTPYEMMCSWASGTGISRLITAPIKTLGIDAFALNFKHYYNDYGDGVTGKVQYSHDLINWNDTGWSFNGGSGSFIASERILISDLSAPITYLAWVMDGNHYQFNYWYVDDVELSEILDHDVAVVALINPVGDVIDMDAGTIDIIVRVENMGLYPESFNVEMTYGTTTMIQPVSNLQSGYTNEVTFLGVTPVLGLQPASFKTLLSTDQNPDNDEYVTLLYGAPLDVVAYSDVLFSIDNYVTPMLLSTLKLNDPQEITALEAPNLLTNSLYAADWIDGGWWGAEAHMDWWHINIGSGAMTNHGTHGLQLGGVAWDPFNDIVYATDGENLYTMNKATGATTLIGALTWSVFGNPLSDGILVSLAFDNNTQKLYGLDVHHDAVFEINPQTLDCAALGFTIGWDLNYAQDMAFDQDTGLLYVAACTHTDGMLLLVNTHTAHTFPDDTEQYMGEGYLIDSFINEAELDGFIIPYGYQFGIPTNLNIAADGTLSWDDVAAHFYKIYSSTDPYSGFTFAGSTTGTSWLDPDFELNDKMFYRVTSADYFRAGQQLNFPATFNNIHSLKKENILNPDNLPSKPGHMKPMNQSSMEKKVK